ncbi:MAG: imidazole glycerol phosphate synthase subunit HisH [Clostridiales bacterium]|nr:imidazole glycerol phosphate synthase subunit HisH [Clostridiales bacterium]
MTAIINYGVGNLFSLTGSLKHLGIEAEVTADRETIENADRIILPGVGAFADAKQKLEDTGLIPVLNEQVAYGKPLLGICLGMQMLFEKSYEYGEHTGLGYIEGDICPLTEDLPNNLKVPHIGWNRLIIKDKSNPLLKYTSEGDYAYYVHSYYAKNCEESVVAYSEYYVNVPGLVCNKNVFGTQFHPEKSGKIGLKMLTAFNEVTK